MIGEGRDYADVVPRLAAACETTERMKARLETLSPSLA
jgi:hypothetical protein